MFTPPLKKGSERDLFKKAPLTSLFQREELNNYEYGTYYG
ncbi:hypothetical protein CRENPOLYSF1_230020 [Crenothrix polyspora]|uniref:Uncharacterized protein n=1 Tax=Crenothrix polyspora TaxID=360316 RepID=A0A1R4H6T8_9GAMM|nr:hypothetical protein CRENPOLYSF1_230020 [Crenothrix polyspora]